jgi:putative ABC transport system permease protein
VWRLLFKNLARNPRRAVLTGSSVAVSLFLLSSLGMVYSALGRAPESGASRLRLYTMRSTGMNLLLPISDWQRIQTVPGVVAVTPMNWIGAYYQDPSQTFANFAVDADTLFNVFSEVKIPAAQVAAFQRDRTGAVAGKRLADKYHWKPGDRITLLNSIYGFDPQLTLRGIYTGSDENQLFFHWDYFNESVGRLNRAEGYWVRVRSADDLPRVSRAIDDLFRNTSAETRTETEPVALLNFIAVLGNVRAVILVIGSAVLFAILLIVANTMALAIRERLPEAAVLRSLGFRPAQIVELFVGEALIITLAGGILGCAAAEILYRALAITQFRGAIYIDLNMRPQTLVLSLLLTLLIGLGASLWPALQAARVNIARALRFVG